MPTGQTATARTAPVEKRLLGFACCVLGCPAMPVVACQARLPVRYASGLYCRRVLGEQTVAASFPCGRFKFFTRMAGSVQLLAVLVKVKSGLGACVHCSYYLCSGCYFCRSPNTLLFCARWTYPPLLGCCD